MLNKNRNGKERILLVDDDPALLKLGQIIIERAGYGFIGASNGGEALRFARAAHPDLILLDYMMPDISGKEVFIQLKISGDEHLRRTPVIMLTAKSDNHTEQRRLLELGLSAYLCKPFDQHELLNVIDHVLVMARITERNRVLKAELRQSFISTVRALVSLLAVKDSYTGEHSNMTANYAEALARRFGLAEAEVMHIKLGALLHDIGKIGVPECILCKPARLTPEETLVMRRHVDYGTQVLESVPHMETVCAIVRHHHEWWGGGGYPAGLRGEEIPLGARIAAVADAYDAMTSDRPYRRRLAKATAIQRLRAAAGIQFDHLVVEELVGYLDTCDGEQPRSLRFDFLNELQYVA